jgi:iron uptake system component EfeO
MTPAPRAILLGCALLLGALTLASCASNVTERGGSPAASSPSASRVTVLRFKLTDAGCDPLNVTVSAGPTTFTVTNVNSTSVTELELLYGDQILSEVEYLTPGASGSFTLNLYAGTYTLSCPNGTSAARGTLTVTGAASAGNANPAVAAAVTSYQAYVVAQAGILVDRTGQFVAAVRQGNIAQAQALYAWARQPYEQIEPIAERFGDLDAAIDAREGDVPDDQWTGFHRIEQALWQAHSLDGVQPLADKLVADVGALQTRVQGLTLDSAQIANGAVALLNEVSASKLAGEEERYSHTDLDDINANVLGARAAFDALQPLLADLDPQLADQISVQFAAVDQALTPVRAGDGFVPLPQAGADATRRIGQAVDALADRLSLVAGELAAAQN